MKAIRAKCLVCCGGTAHEVRLCPGVDCALYLYRFGKNPNIKLTEEQREERAARLQKQPSQQGDLAHALTTEGNYSFQSSDEKKEALDHGPNENCRRGLADH